MVRTIALGSGCVAALGWGLTGVFIKLMASFTTLEILSLRLWIAFLVTLPLLLSQRSLRSQFLVLLRQPIALLLASLMVFYYLFAVRAFQLAPVSDVVLIVGLSPIIGLGVKALLRQPLTRQEGWGASIAFLGLVLFVAPKLQGGGQADYLTGLGFAFLSACVTLAYAALFKSATTRQLTLNPLTVAVATFAIGAVLSLPLVLFSTPPLLLHVVRSQAVILVVGLGILSTVIPTFCYSYAAKHLSPILTTTLNLLTPIFAALIAWFWLQEELPLLSLLGAGMIFTGILMLSKPIDGSSGSRSLSLMVRSESIERKD